MSEELPDELKKALSSFQITQKKLAETINDVEKEVLLPLFAEATNGNLSYTLISKVVASYNYILDEFDKCIEDLPNEGIVLLAKSVIKHHELMLKNCNELREKLNEEC